MSFEHEVIGNCTVITADSMALVKSMADNCIDSVVSDIPYGLGAEPDAAAVLADWVSNGYHELKSGAGGFMGKEWDAFVPQPAFWKEVYRVLKPGGHMCIFAGTRTLDWVGMSLRLAGFEIRDSIDWIYGSGFPKSMNIGKSIDKKFGAEREVVGVNLASIAKSKAATERGESSMGASYQRNGKTDKQAGYQNPQEIGKITAPATDEAKKYEGWQTALKPAHEPILLVRKPISEKSITANVLKWGTGGIYIDGNRVALPEGDSYVINTFDEGAKPWGDAVGANYTSRTDTEGRYPANIIIDGTQPVVDCFPDDKWKYFYCAKPSKAEKNAGLQGLPKKDKVYNGKSSEPSEDMKDVEKRFTTQPAANSHPTVKPVALMKHLVSLVTPPDGCVADFYAGSGTTGVAAEELGIRSLLCEREKEYVPIITARIKHATKGDAHECD